MDKKSILLLKIYLLASVFIFVFAGLYMLVLNVSKTIEMIGFTQYILFDIPEKVAITSMVKEVTAYNVGVEAQTDDTPCIGASNIDLCNELDRGTKVCATNFLPLYSKIYIETIGECVVLDRMNSRYIDRIDIAFNKNQINEALKFGKKNLTIKIYDK